MQFSLDDLRGNWGRPPQGQDLEPGTPSPQHWGYTVPEACFTSQLCHIPAKWPPLAKPQFLFRNMGIMIKMVHRFQDKVKY